MKLRWKIKIVSDGTLAGTRVLDAETGDVIEGVRAVSFKHAANELPHLTLEVIPSAKSSHFELEIFATVEKIKPS